MSMENGMKCKPKYILDSTADRTLMKREQKGEKLKQVKWETSKLSPLSKILLWEIIYQCFSLYMYMTED